MYASTKQELLSIIDEFRSVIAELYDIENGVRRDFTGIGNEKCANSIRQSISQFHAAVQQLNQIDLSKGVNSHEY